MELGVSAFLLQGHGPFCHPSLCWKNSSFTAGRTIRKAGDPCATAALPTHGAERVSTCLFSSMLTSVWFLKLSLHPTLCPGPGSPHLPSSLPSLPASPDSSSLPLPFTLTYSFSLAGLPCPPSLLLPSSFSLFPLITSPPHPRFPSSPLLSPPLPQHLFLSSRSLSGLCFVCSSRVFSGMTNR